MAIFHQAVKIIMERFIYIKIIIYIISKEINQILITFFFGCIINMQKNLKNWRKEPI